MDGCLNDIFECREVIEQIEVLKHHADAGIRPRLCEMPCGTQAAGPVLISDVPALDQDLAPIHLLQMID
jgi:hypothetical protein